MGTGIVNSHFILYLLSKPHEAPSIGLLVFTTEVDIIINFSNKNVKSPPNAAKELTQPKAPTNKTAMDPEYRKSSTDSNDRMLKGEGIAYPAGASKLSELN